jgi:hypothetical protein
MSQQLADPGLQKLPFHGRVRKLRARQMEAEEIIRHDLIHQPTEDGVRLAAASPSKPIGGWVHFAPSAAARLC